MTPIPRDIRLARVAALTAAGLGLLALAGWLLGMPVLASFGVDLVPMAPSTALLFVLFGVLLARRPRAAQTGPGNPWAVGLGALGTGIAFALGTLALQGVYPEAASLGLAPDVSVAGVPTGHMSPVTALLFLLAGGGLLALQMAAPHARRYAVAALSLAGLLLMLCIPLFIAYAARLPLFYDEGVIPPAVTTTVAFLLLGLALWLQAYRELPPTDGSAALSAHVGLVLLLAFCLLVSGIVTIGYLYYRNYEGQLRLRAEEQLTTISELKVEQLTQWRKERLGDATVLAGNPHFCDLVREFLSATPPAAAEAELHRWLVDVRDAYGYEGVILLDAGGATRLRVPDTPGLECARLRHQAPAAAGKASLLDFHRDSPGSPIHLGVMAPLVDARADRRPLGAVVLRIDPHRIVYPLIRRWPTASPTAETLLVRREGGEVVFLNQLRFRRDAALTLRRRLHETSLLAAKAVLRQKGIVDGVDYRGVPVLGDVRPVPDSPWFMIARVDSAEVYAPLHERFLLTVLLTGALVAAAGATVGMVWRHQRSRFYRDQYQTAQMLRASEIRYRRLFESAKDGILILDAESGQIVDVNPYMLELLGLSREAFLARKIWDVGPLKNILAGQASFADLQQKEYLRYDDLPLATAAGELISVEFVSNVYLVNGRKVIQCNIRDITARKRAEEALTRYNAELQARNEEMTRFNRLAVGRELRMIELKQEVNDLCTAADKPAPYATEARDLLARQAADRQSTSAPETAEP